MIFAGFTLVALYVPIASVAGWLLSSQGRGRDYMVLSSIVSFVTVLFFLVGLRFGPVGVAMSYSLSCLLVQLPVAYYIVGRRGPVTTKDLWSRFFKHLPLWGVVCGATWLTRTLVSNFPPAEQLLICVPVGLLAGIVFASAYAPSRQAAMNLLIALQELLKSRRYRSSAK